jgi:hypothetical protein
MFPFAAHVVDDVPVKAFDRERPKRADFLHLIRRPGGVVIGEHDKGARRRKIDEAHGGGEGQRAGAFRADQRAADMKTLFRQQIVEIVAGDAARNVRIAAADFVATAAARSCKPVYISALRPPPRRISSYAASEVAPTRIRVPS